VNATMALTGKRALITGGSAGLGAAIATKLASLGVVCAVNYAGNTERAEKLLASLPGSGHVLVRGSMFLKPDAQKVVKDAISQLGGLDMIVSNAGWTKFADFSDLDALADEDWDQCYAANVKSHLWVMQAARAELKRNEGSFLITASVAGIRPGGSSMAYAVSTAAGIHLAASLAKACAPHITVNCISPGLLDTEWSKGFQQEHLEKIKKASALGRIPSLDDCADTAVMLLQSRSITGQNIEVSAGLGV